MTQGDVLVLRVWKFYFCWRTFEKGSETKKIMKEKERERERERERDNETERE